MRRNRRAERKLVRQANRRLKTSRGRQPRRVRPKRVRPSQPIALRNRKSKALSPSTQVPRKRRPKRVPPSRPPIVLRSRKSKARRPSTQARQKRRPKRAHPSRATALQSQQSKVRRPNKVRRPKSPRSEPVSSCMHWPVPIPGLAIFLSSRRIRAPHRACQALFLSPILVVTELVRPRVGWLR
jgi:hypothetical protein